MLQSLAKRWFGCKVRQWRGCNCIIFTKKTTIDWDDFAGEGTEAFYAYGCFYFKNMKTFKRKSVRRHEWKHRQQAKRDGHLVFSAKYLYYNLVHGYHNNPYESEARSAERSRR
jgi:hypothetical protein